MHMNSWPHKDVSAEEVCCGGKRSVFRDPSVSDPQPAHCAEIKPQQHSILPKAEPLSWPRNDSSLWMHTTQAPRGQVHRAGGEWTEQSSPFVPRIINRALNRPLSISPRKAACNLRYGFLHNTASHHYEKAFEGRLRKWIKQCVQQPAPHYMSKAFKLLVIIDFKLCIHSEQRINNCQLIIHELMERLKKKHVSYQSCWHWVCKYMLYMLHWYETEFLNISRKATFIV